MEMILNFTATSTVEATLLPSFWPQTQSQASPVISFTALRCQLTFS